MEDSVKVSAIPPHTSVSKPPSPYCLLATDIPSHIPLRGGLALFFCFQSKCGTPGFLLMPAAVKVKRTSAAGAPGCHEQG